jgi:hypothetical protein
VCAICLRLAKLERVKKEAHDLDFTVEGICKSDAFVSFKFFGCDHEALQLLDSQAAPCRSEGSPEIDPNRFQTQISFRGRCIAMATQSRSIAKHPDVATSWLVVAKQQHEHGSNQVQVHSPGVALCVTLLR